MELDMMGIGERIKTRRKELKLSQTDIYERCDITSGALSKIENGKTTPSVIGFINKCFQHNNTYCQYQY